MAGITYLGDGTNPVMAAIGAVGAIGQVWHNAQEAKDRHEMSQVMLQRAMLETHSNELDNQLKEQEMPYKVGETIARTGLTQAQTQGQNIQNNRQQSASKFDDGTMALNFAKGSKELQEWDARTAMLRQQTVQSQQEFVDKQELFKEGRTFLQNQIANEPDPVKKQNLQFYFNPLLGQGMAHMQEMQLQTQQLNQQIHQNLQQADQFRQQMELQNKQLFMQGLERAAANPALAAGMLAAGGKDSQYAPYLQQMVDWQSDPNNKLEPHDKMMALLNSAIKRGDTGMATMLLGQITNAPKTTTEENTTDFSGETIRKTKTSKQSYGPELEGAVGSLMSGSGSAAASTPNGAANKSSTATLAPQAPVVKSQAEYDALPSGKPYKTADGKLHIKP